MTTSGSFSDLNVTAPESWWKENAEDKEIPLSDDES